MGAIKALKSEESFQLDLTARGYAVLFRPDQSNHCPGCGHSQWFVGRMSAECGICGTALPLADAQQSPVMPVGQKAVKLHIVSEIAEKVDAPERREDQRVPGDGRVLGLHIDGSPHPFKLEDISDGGVKGEYIPGVGQARSLMIELEDGRMVPAQLRWTDGEYAGFAFLKKP